MTKPVRLWGGTSDADQKSKGDVGCYAFQNALLLSQITS
jgi:hypothetical protein